MNILPALQAGSFVVVLASRAARDEITHVTAELALRGPLTILDGGNRFQAYRIAHLLRQRTTDVQCVSKRLFVRRAFTCYQMLTLLENTPARRQPHLILDLLATFYDDHVKTPESIRLVEACLRQIDRLRQFAPLAVTLGPPLLEERAFLIENVCTRADSIFEETITPQEVQQPLF